MEYNYDEDEFLMLSGIQHFEFCRRQWALIHIEGQWEENYRTIDGSFMHKKAHDGSIREKRGNILIARGLRVFSKTLGVSGECDVVEFHKNEKGISLGAEEGRYMPIPVEYKRGSQKDGDEDILQLTAQAMCLEEMLCCDITKGYLYYGQTKHRTEVEFSGEIRDKVNRICNEMHNYYDRKYTPKSKKSGKCNACSLNNICLPKICEQKSVLEYIDDFLKL